MIVYANGKVLGTDSNGNTSEIAAQGINGDELKVSDNESRDTFRSILAELKIMNLQMAVLTDTTILRDDIEVD